MMFYYDVVIKSKKCSCYFDKKSYINLLFFCSCVYSVLILKTPLYNFSEKKMPHKALSMYNKFAYNKSTKE